MKFGAGGGKISGFQSAMRHENGNKVWVSTSARMNFDANGNFTGVEGVTRDITEKIKLEMNCLKIRKNSKSFSKSIRIFWITHLMEL